jgi:cobalt/nickel transport protein
MSSRYTNIVLTVIAVGIFVLALVIDAQRPGEDERFGGTDAAATEQIEQDNPDYEPWFSPLYAPTGGEIESGLFALQAALGAGVLGYALGALNERRKRTADTARAPDPR